VAIDDSRFYGTVAEADTYFAERLHNSAWTAATTDDKEKALLQATRSIDCLKFEGEKTDDAQLLQFPRDPDVTVPDDVAYAAFEEAYEILSGRRADVEFCNLQSTSGGSGNTRFTSDHSCPPENVANLILSASAWRYLRKYLDDNNTFTL